MEEKNFEQRWEIDYQKFGALCGLPFMLLGLFNPTYFILGISLFVVFYTTMKKKYFWLEVTEDYVRYIHSMAPIHETQGEGVFLYKPNAKEIAKNTIRDMRMNRLGYLIEVHYGKDQMLSIDVFGLKKELKTQILKGIQM